MPGEVWRLTPAEVEAAVLAETERREHQRRLALTLAWVNAALQRQKRLPRLERFLRRPGGTGKELDPASLKKDFEDLKQRFARRGQAAGN